MPPDTPATASATGRSWTLSFVTATQKFMEHYRSAFARADTDALVECFDYPVQVVSVAGDRASVSLAGRDDWPQVIAGLLGAYERLGVVELVLQTLEVDEPIAAVTVVRVHWALQRKDGDAVYDFTAVYTLARLDYGLRIVVKALELMVGVVSVDSGVDRFQIAGHVSELAAGHVFQAVADQMHDARLNGRLWEDSFDRLGESFETIDAADQDVLDAALAQV